MNFTFIRITLCRSHPHETWCPQVVLCDLVVEGSKHFQIKTLSRKDEFYVIVEDPNPSDVSCGQRQSKFDDTVYVLPRNSDSFSLRINWDSSRNDIRHLSLCLLSMDLT